MTSTFGARHRASGGLAIGGESGLAFATIFLEGKSCVEGNTGKI